MPQVLQLSVKNPDTITFVGNVPDDEDDYEELTGKKYVFTYTI